MALLPLVLADKRLVRVLPEYRIDINVALFLLYPAMEFVPPRFSKRR